MTLDLSTFTTRSQQALAAAVQSAAAAGNPAVEPAHLLDALLTQSGGTTGPLLAAVGVDASEITGAVRDELGTLPSASGASVANPSLSRASHEVLQRAQDLAAQLGDEFVSSEHLVAGIATVDSPAGKLLTSAGATPDALQGGVHVGSRQRAGHQPGRRGHVPSAGEVRHRPDRRRT